MGKEILNEKEVFGEYDLGVPWLRKRRRLGLDPPYMKIGKMVRYRREDIEAFLIDHVVNTSDKE